MYHKTTACDDELHSVLEELKHGEDKRRKNHNKRMKEILEKMKTIEKEIEECKTKVDKVPFEETFEGKNKLFELNATLKDRAHRNNNREQIICVAKVYGYSEKFYIFDRKTRDIFVIFGVDSPYGQSFR